MRHFAFLDPDRRSALFHRPPGDIHPDADPRLLATALGATLYSPSVRPQLAASVRAQAARGVTSMVLCLEDAIADHEVAAGEDNVVAALTELADSGDAGHPLLFVRIREAGQITSLTRRLGDAVQALAGFVLPKFSEESGLVALGALARASERAGRLLYAMPVLEHPDLIYRETRLEALCGVRRAIGKHREHVLAARIGATDLCGLFGLRRDRDLTVYDISVVRDVISDVVNVLGRDDELVLTGPVWEYFAGPERLFVSPLRVTPFEHAAGDPLAMRTALVRNDLDRLIREVVLDKANGLVGKTVIHPSHIPAVHALLAVTHEEYEDASTVLSGEAGGVRRSAYANKMNELRPHRMWAEKLMRRVEAYGVLREGFTYADVLGTYAAVLGTEV